MLARVSVPNFEGVLTLKVTSTLLPSSSMPVDLADADAGDPDLVVGLEAAGLGEVGVVGVAAADQRQVAGLEGDERSGRSATAMLIAPIVTGLRSRKGVLMRGCTSLRVRTS